MVARTFALPDLGEGLEEATVDAWLVQEGDTVELNQPIVEIETAKATVEVPSPFAGRVSKLHAAAGATLEVGDPLITIDVASDGQAVIAPGDAPRRGTPASTTPAVRKLAKELGVDLSTVVGSGADGRITREDVGRRAGGEPPPTTRTVPVDAGTEPRAITPTRRTAAQHVAEAATVPTVTTWRTVDCSALERVRADLGVSPLPIVVRALAQVCTEHPSLNASWTDRAILVHRRVHVGIATDTDRGLLVPVVLDAHLLSAREIADRIAALAAAARDGSITPAQLTGHTITVTNTGSYGSQAGTPLLNLPDAVILALGAIEPSALVVDGAVVARPACTLSVTFDHRALDGATVGRALNGLVSLLEDEDALRRLSA